MAFSMAFQKENLLSGSAPRLLFASLLIFSIVIATTASPAYARSNPRYASIIMDADTGMILEQRYADKKLHPASLAKMMTLLLTFDALENGDLSLRDRVVMSRHAASMAPSKLNLPHMPWKPTNRTWRSTLRH